MKPNVRSDCSIQNVRVIVHVNPRWRFTMTDIFTGRSIPSLMFFVCSLNSLQNSPMFTPLWRGRGLSRTRVTHITVWQYTCPKAGPRGGEGEAIPAGMYIRTVATNFPTAFPLPAIFNCASSYTRVDTHVSLYPVDPRRILGRPEKSEYQEDGREEFLQTPKAALRKQVCKS